MLKRSDDTFESCTYTLNENRNGDDARINCGNERFEVK